MGTTRVSSFHADVTVSRHGWRAAKARKAGQRNATKKARLILARAQRLALCVECASRGGVQARRGTHDGRRRVPWHSTTYAGARSTTGLMCRTYGCGGRVP